MSSSSETSSRHGEKENTLSDHQSQQVSSLSGALRVTEKISNNRSEEAGQMKAMASNNKLSVNKTNLLHRSAEDDPQGENYDQPTTKSTSANRETLRALILAFPRIPRTTITALQFFIGREDRFSVHREAYVHYCHQQILLASQSCLKRLRHEVLTFIDIRDMFANVAALHEMTLNALPEYASYVGNLIIKLILIVGDLGACLEAASQQPATDWLLLTHRINKNSMDCAKRETIPFQAYVPRVHTLKSIRLLGVGGFGSVYKGVYLPAQLVCTIKLVTIDRFSRDNNACMDKVTASVTNHHFVVQYFCSFATKKSYVTLMEYIRGVDLLKVLSISKTLSIRQCRVITAQLFLAVEHLHFRGILHRDIKVSNILILVNGQIKLIDFDTNKICIGHFTKRSLKTFYRRTAYEFRDSESAGTLTYMAPEVFRRKPYGRALDWWSVGVTLNKILIGRVPFRSKNEVEIRRAIIHDPIVFPTTKFMSSKSVEKAKTLITQLCSKNAVKRLGSKDYYEIVNHDYFDKVNWDQLREPKSNTEFVSIPETKQVMTPSSAEIGEYSPEASGHSRSQKISRMDELVDNPTSSHVPLFTFISAPFKEICQRLKTEPNTSLSKNFIMDSTDNSLAKTASSVFSTSYNEPYDFVDITSTKDMTREEAEAIEVIIFTNGSTALGFELDIITGENGVSYPVVVAIKDRSPAAASQLIICDVITAVNGKSCANKSRSEIDNALQTSEDTVTLSVLVSSPVRICKTRSILRELLNHATRFRVEISINVAGNYGFSVVTEKAYDPTRSKFARFHMICRTSSNMRIKPPSRMIYPGDIIISIDDKPAAKMNQFDLEKYVDLTAQKGDVLRLKICAISALRQNRATFTRLFEIKTETIQIHSRKLVEAFCQTFPVIKNKANNNSVVDVFFFELLKKSIYEFIR